MLFLVLYVTCLFNFLSGCFKDFLFITGFEQFDDNVPCSSFFLYIAQILLCFLNLQFSSNLGKFQLFLQLFFYSHPFLFKCLFRSCLTVQLSSIHYLLFFFLFVVHFRYILFLFSSSLIFFSIMSIPPLIPSSIFFISDMIVFIYSSLIFKFISSKFLLKF